MKHTLLLIAIGAIACSFAFPFTNSKKNTQEPFSYSFASVDPTTGKIKAKLQPNTAVKQRTKGKTTTAISYTIEGAKSSVRLKFEDNAFEVQSDMQTSTLNPILYIGFYKLTSGKNGRTLVIDPNSADNVIAFNIASTDPGVYRLLVGAALYSGEYAFVDKTTATSEGNLTVWTFGID